MSGLTVVALTVATFLVVGVRATAGHPHAPRTEPRPEAPDVREAKAVALRFFRALDTRHFDRACDLLSARFYQLNAVPSRKICILSLTYGMSTVGVRYRIIRARADKDRAEVTVLADGAPGRLQLVREGRSFKIVSLGAV